MPQAAPKPSRALTTTRKLQQGKPGRPKRNSEDADLKDRILDVAEAHFARQGFEGTSAREIAREVGATPAMIHYYFSSKRLLFDAVFARRASVLNKERMAALNAYYAKAGPNVTVEGAIGAFLHPVLQKLALGDPGWRNYLELVAQIGNKHEWGGEVMTRSFDPVIERLIELIGYALPQASKQNLFWGYHFLSGALLLTLSETDRIDRLSKGLCRSTDITEIEPRLVAFAAAGFRRVCGEQRS